MAANTPRCEEGGQRKAVGGVTKPADLCIMAVCLTVGYANHITGG